MPQRNPKRSPLRTITPIPFSEPIRLHSGLSIAIGGQKLNGKSSLGNLLLELLMEYERYGQLDPKIPGGTGSWRRCKISYPLKKIASTLMQVPMEWIEQNKDAPTPPGWNKNLRWVLEQLGRTMHQANPRALISIALMNGGNTITDDIRSPREYELVKEIGGKTVLIWRPGFETKSNAFTEKSLRKLIHKHVAMYQETGKEGAVDVDPLVDYFIVNDGSEKKLRAKAQKLIIADIFGKIRPRDYSSFAAS